MKYFTTLYLLAVCAIAFVSPCAAADFEAGIDHEYGSNGMVYTARGSAGEEPNVELTVAADGSAVVASGSEGIAVRFDAAGSRDLSFGGSGRLKLRPGIALGRPGKKFDPRTITEDKKGRVVIFGQEYEPAKAVIEPGLLPVSPSRAVVIRLMSNGHLDRHFGRGRGYVASNFGLPAEPESGVSAAGVMTGLVDSKDRPVFVAGSFAPVTGCQSHSATSLVPRKLIRLTPSGLSDKTFGEEGMSTVEGSGSSLFLGLDKADQPVVGLGRTGTYAAACGHGTKVYRFNQRGAPISRFGVGGIRELPSARLRSVDRSGALVFAERAGQDLELIELGSKGNPVPRFGKKGVSKIRLPTQVGIHLGVAGSDAKGRLLLAGFVSSSTSRQKQGRPRSGFIVGRVRADGKIDRSFGKNGWMFNKVRQPFELTSTQASFDSLGHLLVAGVERTPQEADGKFVVARYLLGQ